MKWISANERLPKDNQIVLAWTGRAVVASEFERGVFNRYHNHLEGDRTINYHYVSVTYWMPLPQPPIEIEKPDYWQSKCLAAEEYIQETPCDPDILPLQVMAYNKWQELKNQVK